MINTKKKKIILAIVVALLVSGGAFAYFYLQKNQKDSQADNNQADQGLVENAPPTEEEQKAGDEQKQKNIEEEEQRQQQNNSSNKTANVIITDASQYDSIIEVRAFIPNHYQDGTCTITFTKNSQTVSKETPAYRDVSTTICTNPLIKRSEFPSSGDWKLIVSYRSKDASGASEAKTVKIR